MGWLSGVLSGYADRHGEIRQENAAKAELANQREAAIYKELLNSPDDYIRTSAATGLLQSAQPRKGKGGFAGWMGEMEGNPIFPILQQYMRTPQAVETPVKVPGLPSTQTQGYLSLPPGGQSSLAQPESSPTTGDAMATPRPLPASLQPPPPPPSLAAEPEPPRPPAPPPALEALSPEEEAAAAPPPPPPPAFPVAGFTSQQVPGPASVTRTETRMQLPHAFPTAEETTTAAARAKAVGDVQGDLAGYTEMFRAADPSDPHPEAKAAEMVRQERERRAGGGSAAPYQSIEIEYIDPVTKQIVKTLGSYDKVNARYIDANRNPIVGQVTKALPASALGMGTVANRAMNELHITPLDLRNNPALQAQLNDRIEEIRQDDAYAARSGNLRAGYDAPLTAPQAQAAQLPVGTTSAQVTGQTIPKQADVERARSVTQMASWLDQIDQALDVLPTQDSLGGKFPGAAIAYRRALPEYRTAFAKLDSDINQILASLSRAVQQNVGTQTEQDARRAMDTLALVQGKILNPLDGDTQESARARLAETKAYLQQVIATIPKAPVPQAVQPPAPLPVVPPRPPVAPLVPMRGSAVPSAAPPAPTGTVVSPPAGGTDPEQPPPNARLWTSPSGKVWVNGKKVSRD